MLTRHARRRADVVALVRRERGAPGRERTERPRRDRPAEARPTAAPGERRERERERGERPRERAERPARPARAEVAAAPPKPKPRRLQPGRAHRDAVLA